jgi:hypothetical protein
MVNSMQRIKLPEGWKSRDAFRFIQLKAGIYFLLLQTNIDAEPFPPKISFSAGGKDDNYLGVFDDDSVLYWDGTRWQVWADVGAFAERLKLICTSAKLEIADMPDAEQAFLLWFDARKEGALDARKEIQKSTDN